MEELKEFKELIKENNKLRDKIRKILIKKFEPNKDYCDIWENINKLINNEIEQEKHCNQ